MIFKTYNISVPLKPLFQMFYFFSYVEYPLTNFMPLLDRHVYIQVTNIKTRFSKNPSLQRNMYRYP